MERAIDTPLRPKASTRRWRSRARLAAAVVSEASTVFLAYKLVTHGVACIVCIAVHFVNTAVLLLLVFGNKKKNLTGGAPTKMKIY